MSTTISGTSGVTFPDSTSMQTGQQACKAWVNFNGQGTVAIRDGYNVSTITDNGTGDFTVNFTNAMPNANYSALYTSDANAITNSNPYTPSLRAGGVNASYVRVVTIQANTAPIVGADYVKNCVAIFSN